MGDKHFHIWITTTLIYLKWVRCNICAIKSVWLSQNEVQFYLRDPVGILGRMGQQMQRNCLSIPLKQSVLLASKTSHLPWSSSGPWTLPPCSLINKYWGFFLFFIFLHLHAGWQLLHLSIPQAKQNSYLNNLHAPLFRVFPQYQRNWFDWKTITWEGEG